MFLTRIFAIVFLVINTFVVQSPARFLAMTKLECVSMDERIVTTTKCYIKSNANALPAATINLTLHQEVKRAAIKLQFKKKSNGNYNPYLYNEIVFDACKFMKNRRYSPIANYVFSLVEDFTNMNHTCPYKDYALIEQFHIDMSKLAFMPLPMQTGNYLLKWFFLTNGKEVLKLELYFTYTE